MITKKGLLCFTILKKGYTEKLFPSPQKSFLKGVVCYTFPNKCNSPKRLDSHSQLVFSKFYHKSEALRPLVYGILTLADNAGDYSQNDKGGRGDA